MKRLFDVAAALTGLLLLCPLFGAIAVAVKWDSPGDIFYLQDRVGKDGSIFKIYKFRTMVMNAEQFGAGLFITENDSRITRVGGFLRKTSLDELPQLLNVVRGEMSIIGPRPPIPTYPHLYKDYPAHKKQRFSVLPGITGYAQVKGRVSISWDERIELDLEYIRRRTWRLDLWILLQTVFAVTARKNIYEK
jgi:undecaprenyl phosphate N,N'-diacetylbacillosamine 1-phosphate transferase